MRRDERDNTWQMCFGEAVSECNEMKERGVTKTLKFKDSAGLRRLLREARRYRFESQLPFFTHTSRAKSCLEISVIDKKGYHCQALSFVRSKAAYLYVLRHNFCVVSFELEIFYAHSADGFWSIECKVLYNFRFRIHSKPTTFTLITFILSVVRISCKSGDGSQSRSRKSDGLRVHMRHKNIHSILYFCRVL